VPIAITEEQRAIQQSIADATARMRPVDTVRSAEPDGWRRHWPELARLGLFSITEQGGGLDDQCAALEQAAAALVPGPLLPTVLAGILLARQQDSPLAKELLQGIADGIATAAVALGPDLEVLGAHAGSQLLLCAGESWFVVHPGEAQLAEVDSADFSRPAARIGLGSDAIPTERLLLNVSTRVVNDLAATLAAAEAAGVAGWCARTAAEYAKVRKQFGRAIGGFQAVKHLCAEMFCRAEQASALAWDAARAYTEEGQHALAASAAAAIALDAAVDNAKDCIQVLGGIGFTWEHDAHLYLRRAIALREWLGGSDRWRQRTADLALAGARRQLALERRQDSEIRARVEAIAALPANEQRARLVEEGYLVPHWPKPYGLEASPATQLLIDQELARAGVQRPDLIIGAWAAPTIISFGTEAQRERFVPPTLRGEIQWCQLFSEPEAGSDLASLRTRATKVDGGWRLDGQKVWTSRAREADWGICLARTDDTKPKHQGITYFLVDMRTPGIDIRPLREITGDAWFNEVFLDGVFVPDDCVVGEVNGGWKLARATLANERVAMSTGSALGEAVERLLTRAGTADAVARQRLGALIAQGVAVSLVDLRATLRQLDGQDPGPESSVRKLIGVRHRQDVAEAALELLGSEPELLHEFLLTRCLSIAGGTSQILLNLIGERLLGLPRE
jgi:alkylation response protein AidB-like acyl-CoA dehydrogenase